MEFSQTRAQNYLSFSLKKHQKNKYFANNKTQIANRNRKIGFD